jgi:hypothetical protein
MMLLAVGKYHCAVAPFAIFTPGETGMGTGDTLGNPMSSTVTRLKVISFPSLFVMLNRTESWPLVSSFFVFAASGP